jgi:hypothetical protein
MAFVETVNLIREGARRDGNRVAVDIDRARVDGRAGGILQIGVGVAVGVVEKQAGLPGQAQRWRKIEPELQL